MTRNAHDAEDLVQETFLRAFRAFDGYTPGTNIRAWLHTILYRVRTDAFRRAGRSPQTVEAGGRCLAVPAPRTPWPRGRGPRPRPRRPARGLRTAVVLRDVQELTYEEIAGPRRAHRHRDVAHPPRRAACGPPSADASHELRVPSASPRTSTAPRRHPGPRPRGAHRGCTACRTGRRRARAARTAPRPAPRGAFPRCSRPGCSARCARASRLRWLPLAAGLAANRAVGARRCPSWPGRLLRDHDHCFGKPRLPAKMWSSDPAASPSGSKARDDRAPDPARRSLGWWGPALPALDRRVAHVYYTTGSTASRFFLVPGPVRDTAGLRIRRTSSA